MKINKFYTNLQKNEQTEPATNICVHWTAGTWDQVYDDYHFNICYFKNVNNSQSIIFKKIPEPVIFKINTKTKECVGIIRMLTENQKGQHLYKRNSSSRGVAFAACRQAIDADRMGNFPITPYMLEIGAKFLAEYLIFLNLNTSNIKDHDYWAKLDGYGGYRWDIRPYWQTLFSKIKWYYEKLKNSQTNFEFKSIL